MSESYVKMLKARADKFHALAKFIAINQVNSMALFAFDRAICRTGDEIEVERWYCKDGPTVIHVHSHTQTQSGTTCVPFGWVMEMGASKDLAVYMPFPEKTWEEIITEEVQKLNVKTEE